MSEDEILQAYNILSQNVQDQAARDAAIIGNSQRSLGTLASRVASPTGQTSGLANYTYNRLMRPVVDSTAAALTTQGTGQALSKNLADALRAAKNAYQDAQNRYTVASTTPSTTGTTGGTGANTGYTESTDNLIVEGEIGVGDESSPYTPPKGTLIAIAPRTNGAYTLTIADGNGGVTLSTVQAGSVQEARDRYLRENPGSLTASSWMDKMGF